MRRAAASLCANMHMLAAAEAAGLGSQGLASQPRSCVANPSSLRRPGSSGQPRRQQSGCPSWVAATTSSLAPLSGRARQRQFRSAAAAAAAQPALVVEDPVTDAADAAWQPALDVEQLAAVTPPRQQPEPFQLPVPNFGYTCLNLELQQAHGVRTNRSCRRRTLDAQGLPLASRLALANVTDLLAIVRWNAARAIHFFRIPSALFPWSSEYELEALPDYEEIAATLAAVGAEARAARQRLTAHPSHFVQLASPDTALLASSLAHLELNARTFDLMGYAPSHTNKINIHVGATHGSKPRSLARFAAALDRLSHSARARLTVENDDRPGMFSLAELLPLHAAAGTPLVFDYLHHALVPGGLGEREALEAALGTWPPGVRPVLHYSEPSEDPAAPRRAHSCMLTQPFELYGWEAHVDVMLEAKGMERALLFYRDELQLGRKRETPAPPPRSTAATRRAATL